MEKHEKDRRQNEKQENDTKQKEKQEEFSNKGINFKAGYQMSLLGSGKSWGEF